LGTETGEGAELDVGTPAKEVPDGGPPAEGLTAEEFAFAVVDLHGRLARAVMAMSGDSDLAEESAQEALLRAWIRTEAGDAPESLEARSMTVALNHCRSQLRRRGAEQRANKRWFSPAAGKPRADPPMGATLSADVHAAVLALPERQREVVVLHYLLDWSVSQTSDATETSQGAVKNALFNARKRLARSLGDTTRTTDPPVSESNVAGGSK
jgi:RNA polymerase sigma-70 factor (ECF subfamily)